MSVIAKYNGISAYTLKPNNIDTREMNGVYTPNQIPQTGLLLSYDPANPKSYSGSGTTLYDLSGNSNDSILVGGLESNYNSAGWFSGDGVNDAIDATQTFSLSGTQLGLGCWFRVDNDTNESFTQFNQLQNSTTRKAKFGFSILYDGVNYQVFGRLADGSGTGRNNRSQNISLNTWYYVFAKVDSATDEHIQYLFDSTGLIDTQSRTNNAGNWVTNPVDGFYIYVSSASSPKEISVGESHLYNNNYLTQAEVESIYENTKARYGY